MANAPGRSLDQYIANYKKKDDKGNMKGDDFTILGTELAIAEIGNLWNQAEINKDWKKLVDVTYDANGKVKDVVLKDEVVKKAITDNIFLKQAGTQDLARTYAELAIKRSFELDQLQGADKGTNFKKYMEKLNAAIRLEYPDEKDFQDAKARAEKFKKDGLLKMSLEDPEGLKKLQQDFEKFTTIKQKVGKAAKDHLKMNTTIEQDFINVIEVDHQKPKAQRKYQEETIPAPEQSKGGGGFLGLLMMILMAVLKGGNGGNLLQGLLGGKSEGVAQNQLFNFGDLGNLFSNIKPNLSVAKTDNQGMGTPDF